MWDSIICSSGVVGSVNAGETEADPDPRGDENIEVANGVHEFSDCDIFDTRSEPEQ